LPFEYSFSKKKNLSSIDQKKKKNQIWTCSSLCPILVFLKMGQEAIISIFAGGIGGGVGALVTCPLEVVKTRMQALSHRNLAAQQKQPLGYGVARALRHVWMTEGMRGMFRGIVPTLVGVVPARSLYFTTYTSLKRHFVDGGLASDGPLLHMLCAAAAGVATASATNPIWMVKTRMQLSTSSGGDSAIALTRQIVRQEGVIALWRGVSASYLGVAETALQWVVYEQMKRRVIERRAALGKDDVQPSAVELFAVASAAKLFASTCTYPHEVARTRLREPDIPYKGLFDCLKQIARHEGIAGLYGGLGPHLIRVVPNTAITFMTFELVSRYLRIFLDAKD
jgi:solute carrier family 25, member 33/36